MGWKNVKEHYGIGHIVQVTENGICIGSPYVHDLMVISPDFSVRWGTLGSVKQLEDAFRSMRDDPATLRRLVETPDTFSASVTVYTYRGGEILEKQCEELGWPNVTHDGLRMYENTFSANKAEVIGWAKRNAAYGVKYAKENVAEAERRLAEVKEWLGSCEADLAKLEADFTDISSGRE